MQILQGPKSVLTQFWPYGQILRFTFVGQYRRGNVAKIKSRSTGRRRKRRRQFTAKMVVREALTSRHLWPQRRCRLPGSSCNPTVNVVVRVSGRPTHRLHFQRDCFCCRSVPAMVSQLDMRMEPAYKLYRLMSCTFKVTASEGGGLHNIL